MGVYDSTGEASDGNRYVSKPAKKAASKKKAAPVKKAAKKRK